LAETDELLRRLDLIRATLALAYEPQIAAARERIRSDEISGAILDETEDWIASPELQKKVSAQTKKGERAVRNRFPILISQGALEARGTELRKEYRRTALV
jgi:hypothetical protein